LQKATGATDVHNTGTTALFTMEIDPINTLVRHFFQHHRGEVVQKVNEAIFGNHTIANINDKIGDLMTVRSIVFDVYGPLDPTSFFRCTEVKMTRGEGQEGLLGLVHMDLAIKYNNRLKISMHAIRHRGTLLVSQAGRQAGRQAGSYIVGTFVQAKSREWVINHFYAHC
jgi:hypothetical protein